MKALLPLTLFSIIQGNTYQYEPRIGVPHETVVVRFLQTPIVHGDDCHFFELFLF